MNIKEYIHRVYTLEVSCYEQQFLIRRLQEELKRANNPRFHTIQEISSSRESDIVGGIIAAIVSTIAGGGISFVVLVALLALGIIFRIATTLDSLFNTSLMTLLQKDDARSLIPWFVVGGAILGLIFGIRVFRIYVNSGESERNNILIHNQQAAAQNQQIATTTQIRINHLQTQLNQAKILYQQTASTLKQFYDLEIIYPKYRGLVPISMFYEYLSSGRCSRLDGHEGAYNIYEQELRMNLILSKLDDIIERLDQIQESQYLIANAIRESNRTAQQICNAVVHCSNQLQDINENTEATKYFSQITAMNTTYMAWFKNYNK